MLTAIGDLLNWLAAAALFPLLLTPLAGLGPYGRSRAGAVAWLVLAAAIVAAGFAFAALAPRLTAAPSAAGLAIFAAALIALALGIAAAGGPRLASERLAPAAELITRGAGRAVMWLVFFMAVTQFAAVIMRYVFGVNFIFLQESVTYMHGAVFLVAAGYALLTDDHVRVDIFYSKASPRLKALIDLVGVYFLLLPVCLLILWTSTDYVGNAWAVREGSTEQSGIQGIYLLKTLIPAFAILMLLAGFSLAVRSAAALRPSPSTRAGS